MTKRQKGKCSSPGCHNDWSIDFGTNLKATNLFIEGEYYRYYCPEHWTNLMGILSKELYEAKYANKWFIKYIDKKASR